MVVPLETGVMLFARNRNDGDMLSLGANPVLLWKMLLVWKTTLIYCGITRDFKATTEAHAGTTETAQYSFLFTLMSSWLNLENEAGQIDKNAI